MHTVIFIAYLSTIVIVEVALFFPLPTCLNSRRFSEIFSARIVFVAILVRSASVPRKRKSSICCATRKSDVKIKVLASGASLLTCINITRLKLWAAPMAQWISLHLPCCGPGFKSQEERLRFFQFLL